MYYTIQSNLLILAMFGVLIVKTAAGLKKDGCGGCAGYLPQFVFICMIDIILTFSVYWVMLVPDALNTGADIGLWTFSNLSAHAVTPVLCAIDYFVFTAAPRLKYRDIYYTLIYPLIYMLASTIAGFSGYVYRIYSDGSPVRFPYFFFDYDRIGAGFILYTAALIVFFVALGHIIYWFDKKAAKRVSIPEMSGGNKDE
jgi:hypothetical protein